jgi:hypothetical protein
MVEPGRKGRNVAGLLREIRLSVSVFFSQIMYVVHWFISFITTYISWMSITLVAVQRMNKGLQIHHALHCVSVCEIAIISLVFASIYPLNPIVAGYQ